MRTFLALRPPPRELEHLRAVLPRWPSAPERWHLTLAFLGEVPDPRALSGPCAEVCAGSPPLRLQLRDSGRFGRGGPVWVGVAGDTTGLGALAEELAVACRREGIEVDRRPYRPHLTVGRRGRPDPAALDGYAGPLWTAAEVELVVSALGPPVEHVVLDRLPLLG